MSLYRMDKFLADMGCGTRSEVKNYIRKGRVTVNGSVVKSPDVKIDSGKDLVTFDGKPLTYVEMEYFMLNKPQGVISATEDRKDRTVLDLIETKNRKDLFPVGRLDKDTEGLLLITNDGQLAHNLLSPKKHVDKVYYAEVDGVVTDDIVREFANGIILEDGTPTQPAVLKILETADSASGSALDSVSDSVKDTVCSKVELTIHEGKFHQVKRMFEACGMKVTFLKRLRMGSLSLDESLLPGEYRKLTDDEIEALKGGAENDRNSHISDTKQENDKEHITDILKDIEAVIFDMDGTLIDSMWIWREIDIAFLGERNITMPDNLQKIIEGKSFHETAVYFKETFGLPESLDEIKNIWNQMAYEKYSHGMQLKSGVREFLTMLHERKIKLGIATSNSRPLTEACLLDIGVLDYFGTIVTGNEITNGKPQPDIYLKAAQNLEVNPEKCLVFEDVPMGILAGKRAGMKTCAVYDSFSEHMDDEKKELADYYILDYKVITK